MPSFVKLGWCTPTLGQLSSSPHSPTFPRCGLSACNRDRTKNSSCHIPLQRVSSSCLIVEENWVMQISQRGNTALLGPNKSLQMSLPHSVTNNAGFMLWSTLCWFTFPASVFFLWTKWPAGLAQLEASLRECMLDFATTLCPGYSFTASLSSSIYPLVMTLKMIRR